jgi:hypothetical protein
MTSVTLHPLHKGRYRASLSGVLLVESSRDPEHDAARTLLARGITGRMTTIGLDGKPRMHFDIETAARQQAVEGNSGPKIVSWSGLDRSPARVEPSEAAE